MNKKGVIVLCLCVLMLLAAVCGYSKRTNYNRVNIALSKIRNEDLKWRGGFNGLNVKWEQKASLAPLLLQNNQFANEILLKSLDDESKNIAGHVILCELYGNPLPITSEYWHGIRINLTANGEVILDQKDFRQIKAYWQKTLGAKKRWFEF